MRRQAITSRRNLIISFLSCLLTAGIVMGCTGERADAEYEAATAERIREAAEREQRQLRVIRLHLEDLRANMRSIRERLRESDHADVVEHAEEMYDLVQQARMAAVDVRGDKGELILRDLSDLQHAVDELKDVASEPTAHTEIEHALDAIDQGMKRLDGDIS